LSDPEEELPAAPASTIPLEHTVDAPAADPAVAPPADAPNHWNAELLKMQDLTKQTPHTAKAMLELNESRLPGIPELHYLDVDAQTPAANSQANPAADPTGGAHQPEASADSEASAEASQHGSGIEHNSKLPPPAAQQNEEDTGGQYSFPPLSPTAAPQNKEETWGQQSQQNEEEIFQAAWSNLPLPATQQNEEETWDLSIAR
jgi:hypothetical protein